MYVVFDYVCSKCEHTDELLVKRTEMNKQACPTCHKRMTRLPAGTRTHFKFADRTAHKS